MTSAHHQNLPAAQNYLEQQQQQQQQPFEYAVTSPALDHQQVVTGNYHHYQQLLRQQQQLSYLYDSGIATRASTVDASLCSQQTQSNAMLLKEHQRQFVLQHQLMMAALQQEEQLRLWFQHQQFQRQTNALGVNNIQPCFPLVPNIFGFSFNHQ